MGFIGCIRPTVRYCMNTLSGLFFLLNFLEPPFSSVLECLYFLALSLHVYICIWVIRTLFTYQVAHNLHGSVQSPGSRCHTRLPSLSYSYTDLILGLSGT